MKYAIVTKGKVENVIEYDGKSRLDVKGELVKADDVFVNVGFTYKDGKFTDPDAPKKDPEVEKAKKSKSK